MNRATRKVTWYGQDFFCDFWACDFLLCSRIIAPEWTPQSAHWTCVIQEQGKKGSSQAQCYLYTFIPLQNVPRFVFFFFFYSNAWGPLTPCRGAPGGHCSRKRHWWRSLVSSTCSTSARRRSSGGVLPNNKIHTRICRWLVSVQAAAVLFRIAHPTLAQWGHTGS